MSHDHQVDALPSCAPDGERRPGAIFEPEFEPAAKAGLADRELVIGVVGEKEQRAYSTWQLDRHEIVNDMFEGRPIAVTW